MLRLGDTEKNYLSNIKNYSESFTSLLEKFNEHYTKKDGVKPAKSKVCAEALLHCIAKPSLEGSIEDAVSGKDKEFIWGFDSCIGVINVASSILTAIDILDKGDRKEYAWAVDLYEKDPTGFLLISQIVDGIKKESEGKEIPDLIIEPYQSYELIYLGAQFGQKVYSALYQLWSSEK